MSVLFINGSPNKGGNTVHLAKALLGDTPYTQLDLVDLKIYGYGQDFADDQFGEVLDALKVADTVVIGAPMYWHSIGGMVRNVLDRMYGAVDEGGFAGKTLYFLFQGAAPTSERLAAAEYTMSRFAALYGMTYGGMATTPAQARSLGANLQ
ncbi:MAG: flavodoxin family protein [Eggerthellaceae bacterium]|jgi:multimeric flavodoxin WrbA